MMLKRKIVHDTRHWVLTIRVNTQAYHDELFRILIKYRCSFYPYFSILFVNG